MEQPKQLKVALIGCGNIASYHVKAALLTAKVAITVLIDPVSKQRENVLALIKQQQEGREVKQFDSLTTALEADWDGVLFEACIILVPSFLIDGQDLHETVASEALRAKRHVLLEKPVTVTVAAAKRLQAVHQESCPDKVFAVAENAQFWPEVMAAKASIERGDIGTVLTARAKFYESASGEWAGDYAEGTWRCDESKLPSASFTYDGASHWIRPLRLWLGECSRVVGVTGKAVPHMAGASWSQHILCFEETGVSAIFESLLAPEAISDQPFFTIQGTKGELVLHGFGGGCDLHTASANGETTSVELCKKGWDEGYSGEWRDFVAAVMEEGKVTEGPIEAAIKDLEVLQAMFESHREARWVPVGQ